MATIREVFDRPLNRPIEKVITYQNRADAQLKAEIGEYIVTDHIADQFESLLKLMQSAQQGGGGHEIGAWVSGFYGSGKSSFTKYLGFALNKSFKVGPDSFLNLLQNRIQTPNAVQVRALFNSVASVYDAEIIFLDLASEMLASSSLEDISTVLYLKVLQWAGYSEDIKIAELERMLEKDGKLAEFHQRAQDELEGIPWLEVHNQPLVANSIATRLAAVFYPKIFPTPEAFHRISVDILKSELRRSEEMLALIRRKSGKKNILFIIDEVGQYVSAKPNLILNLDGFAKNLKQLGGGSVWLFATAQQTLTEDNASAALNAPGLYKLKDRFPIQIHLEATDIKEICHKRLLSKSAHGESLLGALFDSYGPQLRTATQLKEAGIYEVALDKKTFLNLYPFLPAHFEILMQLLSRLARKTGGIGLRSAIKIIQDVLNDRVHRATGDQAFAEAPLGTLATTVTFYESLRRDIQTHFPHIVEGVKKVEEQFAHKPNLALAVEVAKSIAILQIIEGIPVNAANLAALIHTRLDAPSRLDGVVKVIDELLKNTFIPLGEKNGNLRFLTQAAVTLQSEFDQIGFRQADIRAEINSALRALLKPLPSARLSGGRPVTAGVRVVIGGGQSVPLEGEREPVQFHLEFVQPSAYEQTRTERTTESCAKRERTTLFILGRADLSAEALAATILRCRKFTDAHRTASDTETLEFVKIVEERHERTARELENKLRTALHAGSFVAHGTARPVTELNPLDLAEACRAFLGEAAGRIFDKYAEAPVQADSDTAELFLKTPLNQITAKQDPLTLVTRVKGQAGIKTGDKALTSVRDYLATNGQVEGRRLLDYFNEPPYGWSKDTTRYLLAALITASEIKLRIAGQDYQVRSSDELLAAFTSNKAFGAVGVSLREERPDPDALLRASQRLRELTGQNIEPLPDDIALAAKRHLPTFQQDYSALGTELRTLGLPGVERAENLSNTLAEIVRGDGTDAIARLGAADSPLFDALKWARQVALSFKNGLRPTIASLQNLRTELTQLPSSGAPGKLRQASTERLEQVADLLTREDVHEQAAALGTCLQELEAFIATAVTDFSADQSAQLDHQLDYWQNSPDWTDLSEDERASVGREMERLKLSPERTLPGLRSLLAHTFDLTERVRALGTKIAGWAKTNRAARTIVIDDETETLAPGQPKPAPTPVEERPFIIPRSIETAAQLDELIKQLQGYRDEIAKGKRLKLLSRLWQPDSAKGFPTYEA
jgi:hypothetical protein